MADLTEQELEKLKDSLDKFTTAMDLRDNMSLRLAIRVTGQQAHGAKPCPEGLRLSGGRIGADGAPEPWRSSCSIWPWTKTYRELPWPTGARSLDWA